VTTRPTRTLPAHPDLDQLKRQARELLDAYRAGDARTSAEVHAHDPDAAAQTFALHDAQLVVARAYGFDSWPKLKTYVDGATAKRFIEAARANDVDLVTGLLKIRPDLVDMQWSYGDERRALHYAVMKRLPDMVRVLMRHGANPGAGVHPHREATAPRTMAIERGFTEIVAIIDEEAQSRRTAKTSGPLAAKGPQSGSGIPSPGTVEVVRAVVRGDTDWLRTRHERHPLVNPIRWDDGGLLTLAASSNRPEVLALLLDFGFDPDERVRWNEGPDAAYSQGYPLWHCAATGKHAMAELLLQRGANPNVHVDSSGSAVYAAYGHRQWAMVDLLKQHGGLVTPDIVGLYRETDLAANLLAAPSGTPLPEGAIPPGRTLEDYLLEFALSGGAADIVRMALEKIDWSRDDRRWFRMLGRGLDFWHHMPGLSGTNPSLDRDSYLIGFRFVVERCDPNVMGGFGRTALHEVAAVGDHVTDTEASALVSTLLDAGARTDLRDDLLESTPLGWACRWGRQAIVQVLLERGANALEPDAETWATPRAWATTMKRDSVLALLTKHTA
jgi:ankyrin repeat protein